MDNVPVLLCSQLSDILTVMFLKQFYRCNLVIPLVLISRTADLDSDPIQNFDLIQRSLFSLEKQNIQVSNLVEMKK